MSVLLVALVVFYCFGLLLICPIYGIFKVGAVLRFGLACTNAGRSYRVNATIGHFAGVANRYAGVDSLAAGRPSFCLRLLRVAYRWLCLIGNRRFELRFSLLPFAYRVMDANAVCFADQRDQEGLLGLSWGLLRYFFSLLANCVLHKVDYVCLVFRIVEQDDDSRLCNDGVLFDVVLGLFCSLDHLAYACGRSSHDREVWHAYVSCFRFLCFRPPTSIVACITCRLGQYPSREFVRGGCFSFFGVRWTVSGLCPRVGDAGVIPPAVVQCRPGTLGPCFMAGLVGGLVTDGTAAGTAALPVVGTSVLFVGASIPPSGGDFDALCPMTTGVMKATEGGRGSTTSFHIVF